jgi:heavy metal translocating P-type ATPase
MEHSENGLVSIAERIGIILVVMAVAGLAAGGLLWWSGLGVAAGYVWTAATLPVLLGLLVEIVASLRRADVGLDIIAALSMSAALIFGEPLAANVVALMYAGGQMLERYAEGQARREMTSLLGRVARTAMRRRGTELEEVPIESIRPGDTILIRQGEVLPVDGMVADGAGASLDLSALTGESLPQSLVAGAEASSGSTSLGAPFDLVATHEAADSAYAAIVRLVENARASKSPMMRIADRYSLAFLAFTLVLAFVAFAISHEPSRAVAVLVVATPCPLILAVPIAFISGMSRVAKFGVLVKSAGVFETMARIKVAIVDKTGTLTRGAARLADIQPASGFSADEVLRSAASLDQASGHVLASALIDAAVGRGLVLTSPSTVVELPGAGIQGTVDGHLVAVGGDRYIKARTHGESASSSLQADTFAASVSVAIDGRLAGLLLLDDPLRDDAQTTMEQLRKGGIERIVLASGDKPDVATRIGHALGVDEVLGGLTPSQKVDAIRAARQYGATLMVGDGVNDAPALAAADVGIAMGARGSAASSETAGAVLLVDRLAPLPLALKAARRTRRIALQSVIAGLGLSSAAMIVAAFGFLPPVEGALLQEAIDVTVIFNALRALR